MVRRRVLVGYCLVVGGLAVALGGVVVAATANVPGDRGDASPRWRAPDGWLAWLALGLAVAWLVWARPAAFGAPRRRIGASVAMAAGCAAALIVLLVRMPSRGIELSFSLTVLGVVLSLVGVLAVLAGSLPCVVGDTSVRHPVSRRTRWLVRGGSVTVAAILAAGLAVGVVPRWMLAVNTAATTATPARSADWRSSLDGSVTWRVQGLDEAGTGDGYTPFGEGTALIGTAGGVAVLDVRGVRMLDPTSGEIRWSYRRWDVNGQLSGRPSRLDPGYVVSADGRSLAMTYRLDAPRRRLIDDHRDRDRVWVFDTVSGQLRADVPLPRDTRPEAVTGDRILVSIPAGDDQPEDGRMLAAVDHGGNIAWRYRPGAGCAPARVITVDGDLLALVACEETQSLIRLDARTGTTRWTWRAAQYGGDAASHGHAQRRQYAVLAIAGDTAVVDVRVTYETRQYGTTGEITAVTVWHNLVGLRLADGKQAWQRPDQHYGDLPTSRWRAGLSVLYAAPGTVVLAEQHESGQGPARQQAIALRAFTAATGEPAWSVDLPGGEFVATALNSDLAARTDSVVLLPDGRLVLMYLDFAAPNGPDRCVVAAWNTATGARQADVRLFRTARDAVSTRCSSSIPVEVGNAVALQVPQQGLVMLR